MAERETALIVGAGRGLSAALARKFAAEGVQVALAEHGQAGRALRGDRREGV